MVNSQVSSKAKTKQLLPPALLIAFQMFIYGPTLIYAGNVNEFGIGLPSLLAFLSLAAAMMLLVVVGSGLLLPEGAFRFFVSLTLATGILLWIQGGFLVWDYGVLGKGEIAWSEYPLRTAIDGAIWVVGLSVGLLFHRWFFARAKLLSLLLLGLQLGHFLYMGGSQPAIWTNSGGAQQTVPASVFEFSKKQNVLHVILDELQSTIFEQIVMERPSHYQETLEGFIFFRDTLGSFPTTLLSMPAILSGRAYKNEVPIEEFLASTLGGKTIVSAVHEAGYEVDLAVLPGWHARLPHTNLAKIPVPYGLSAVAHALRNSAFMLTLVAFRYGPQPLKQLVTSIARSLFRRDVAWMERERHLAHRDFLQDLIDRASVVREMPVYKFLHLTTTHWPAILNADCNDSEEILPWNWKNITSQARCGLDHFLVLLGKLRSLGIYDSTLIILQADHGYWKIPESSAHLALVNLQQAVDANGLRDTELLAQVMSSSMPLLTIKPPFSNGKLRISEYPAMLTDIPETIVGLLGLTGGFGGKALVKAVDVLERPRVFRYYERLCQERDRFCERLDEYEVTGTARDGRSWLLKTSHFPPGQKHQSREILFGTDETSAFLGHGWWHHEAGPSGNFKANWAVGKKASVFISLPKGKPVFLSARLKSIPFQQITVLVDGKKYDRWHLTPTAWDWNEPLKWEEHQVIVEPDPGRADTSILEFSFSRNKEPDESDKRRLAALFNTEVVQEFPEYDWGTTIEFGEAGTAGRYQREGWHEPEDGFTWSKGARASFGIPIVKPEAASMKLVVRLSPFIVEGKVTVQRVRVLANGKRVAEWVLKERMLQEKTALIPAVLVEDLNYLRLTFETPDAVAPQQVGFNNDSRVLGVAFYAIEMYR